MSNTPEKIRSVITSAIIMEGGIESIPQAADAIFKALEIHDMLAIEEPAPEPKPERDLFEEAISSMEPEKQASIRADIAAAGGKDAYLRELIRNLKMQ